MTRRGTVWLLGVLPAAVVMVMGWQHRWMSDDGFIHLRVVQQIAGGNGPVFNLGERVEASTSPLWVWLLALTEPIPGVSLPWKAVVLGIALTALGLVAAQAAAQTFAHARGGRAVVVPVGALVMAGLPPFWDFASSGLETGLTFAWLGGSCWWSARRVTSDTAPSPRVELAGAALLGLGILIRPDLAIFSAAFAAVLFVVLRRSSRRRRVGALAAMLALPCLYQVFRMGYYAMLVPNTALAKEASQARWEQGWRYLDNLVGIQKLWFPAGLLVVALAAQCITDLGDGARLRAAARLAPAVAAVVHGLYIIRIGGDFMHARLLLPSVFALVAPIGVPVRAERNATRPLWEGLPLATGLAVAAWTLASATVLPRPESTRGVFIEDERHAEQFSFGIEHPVDLDERIRRHRTSADLFLPPATGRLGLLDLDDPYDVHAASVELRTDLPVPSAAVPPGLGAGSNATDLDVYAVDPGSLASPVGSHLDLDTGGRPGHEKTMPVVWQMAGLADGTEVWTVDGTLLLVSRADAEAANRAIACGRMRTYLRDIQEPLTPGRFLGNLVDSVGNTFFRMSPDPHEAEADLCGE